MSSRQQIVVLVLALLAVTMASAEQEVDMSTLGGPYLGQQRPGTTPEIFAPGIVSRKQSVHSATRFSPDGTEMYWTVMRDPEPSQIVFTKLAEGQWTQPREVPFSSAFDDANPFLSVDGNSLYFKSYREKENALWVTRRQNDRWTTPERLEGPFASRALAWQASITRDGTIYFVQAKEGFGSHDIYRAKKVDGTYGPAERMEAPVNSDIDDWQVFVDPDEELLIFGRYRQPDPSHQNGLYVSFRRHDGEWSEPASMGSAINGEHGAFWPYLSPDKRYLFFVSDLDNGRYHYDVFWVDAQIIEKLKPAELP